MKVSCGHCSELHDISGMEPSFALPDCIAAMGQAERRGKSVLVSKDVCAIRDASRGFIRVLLPFNVEDGSVCNWGLWVEATSYEEFRATIGVWTDPELLRRVLSARLANELPLYPKSIGAPGLVSFQDTKTIGRLNLLHAVDQPMTDLVREQRDGVTVSRKLEWLMAMLHPVEPAS